MFIQKEKRIVRKFIKFLLGSPMTKYESLHINHTVHTPFQEWNVLQNKISRATGANMNISPPDILSSSERKESDLIYAGAFVHRKIWDRCIKDWRWIRGWSRGVSRDASQYFLSGRSRRCAPDIDDREDPIWRFCIKIIFRREMIKRRRLKFSLIR